MHSSASDERDILAYAGDTPPASPVDSVGQTHRRPMRQRLARHVVNGLIVGSVMLVLLGPVVLFLIALTWGVFTSARSVVLLVGIVHARDFAALGPRLHLLNIAARLTLLSSGYFALVFSLIVLYAGALRRIGRRASLIPGVLLTLPSTVAYLIGAVLTGASVATATGIPIQVQALFFLYVFFDAFALGVLLADTRRPAHRARRFMRRRRYFLWQRMPYYSRRLQSRYAVIREALHETEPPATIHIGPVGPPTTPETSNGSGALPDAAQEHPLAGEDEPSTGWTTVA